jgi:hypothetical protein
MTKEQLAELCHEVNRMYCKIIGDESQPPWAEAPDWQKESTLAGVQYHLDNPYIGRPVASHDNWMTRKLLEGWRYGPIKDVDKKEHPRLLPYYRLPVEQRIKDDLFSSIVNSCRPFFQTPEQATP